MTLHDTIQRVTGRITRRSGPSRTPYLQRLRAAANRPPLTPSAPRLPSAG